MNCIKEAEGSAQRLLQLIVTEFPCYRDQATFNGKTGNDRGLVPELHTTPNTNFKFQNGIFFDCF